MMQRILALLIALLPSHLLADDETAADRPAFYLEDGDRVVLLGGTIIEREQVYGEWELMLTCLYADADFTVRNLGWSGDTVWAESRGIFDPPEVGYQRMIDQIKDLNPTVVILAYGHNEAWAGEAGLDAFITQYEKLIDDIQAATEAETRYLILLPHPHLAIGGELPNPGTYNQHVNFYSVAIANLAATRRIPTIGLCRDPQIGFGASAWVNLSLSAADGLPVSFDGVNFTQLAYQMSGLELQKQFERWAHDPVFGASLSLSSPEGSSGFACDQTIIDDESGAIQMRCLRANLIDPDASVRFSDESFADKILRIDGEVVATEAYDLGWEVKTDPDSLQREQLRQAIIRKNELYFHRWRPQNVTYLFGFRAHEQGNNAVEIPQFDPLIEEQESLIRELKHPVEHVWELAPAE